MKKLKRRVVWMFVLLGLLALTANAATKDKTSQAGERKYQGNTQSYVFHRPGCQYYNCERCKVTFNTREEALNAGYTPCPKCKP